MTVTGENLPRGYITFFMLNSTRHEIFSAYKLKMPIIVGIFIFISRDFLCSAMFSKKELEIC